MEEVYFGSFIRPTKETINSNDTRYSIKVSGKFRFDGKNTADVLFEIPVSKEKYEELNKIANEPGRLSLRLEGRLNFTGDFLKRTLDMEEFLFGNVKYL